MNTVQPHCRYIEQAVRSRHLEAALNAEPNENGYRAVLSEVQNLGSVYMQTGAVAHFAVQRDGCGLFGIKVTFAEHGQAAQEFLCHVEHTPDTE